MQKSLSLMALDISARRGTIPASPMSPEPSPSSAPGSPHHGSSDSNHSSTALYLKAVSDGASRLLAAQQHHNPQREPCISTSHVSSSSPASSYVDSPQHSPLQERLSSSISPQPQSLLNVIIPPVSGGIRHDGVQLQSAVRSLKFSIENILSPEFGNNNNGKNGKDDCKSNISNGEKSHHINYKNHRKQHQHPLDISSLTNNRKHSSDSESSTISSLSTTSKDVNNGKRNEKTKTSKGNINNNNDSLIKNFQLDTDKPDLTWPAWVYCTRYSDRPSSGPRSRKMKKKEKKVDEKRPRTAFTAEQLARLKQEFQENRYLTEKRRQDLARDLKLNESQIKIWFQNKRAKIKKSTGSRNPLALHLMAQGLYNHSTVSMDEDDDYDEDRGSSCTSPSSTIPDIKNNS